MLMHMTCASEGTGIASPASAREIQITKQQCRISIPPDLLGVTVTVLAEYGEVKAAIR